MGAPQSGIYHYRSPKDAAISKKHRPRDIQWRKCPAPRWAGEFSYGGVSLSRRSPRSGREMGHLRRPRIDVQIGGPFTQQLAASDTLAPSPYPYPEHKMKEEEGDLAFPHKED